MRHAINECYSVLLNNSVEANNRENITPHLSTLVKELLRVSVLELYDVKLYILIPATES